MSDLTPEGLGRAVRNATEIVADPMFGDAVEIARALLHYKARAVAAEADARRWKVWRRLRPICLGRHFYIDPETGNQTGGYEDEWATPEWMDAEADRLAAEQEKEGHDRELPNTEITWEDAIGSGPPRYE